MCSVLPKIKPIVIAIIIAVVFYVMNVFVLVDKFVVREFFFGIGGYISLGLKLFALVVFSIMSLMHYFEQKRKKEAHSGEVL